MSRRSYEVPSIDAGYQHITEAPAYQEQAETVENVPVPDGGPPDVDGQSTLEDCGWSP